MNLNPKKYEIDIDTKYSNFPDKASQTQQIVRLKQIERINYENFLKFQVNDLIKSTKQKTQTEIGHLWLKAYFDNEWWCTYTDNKDAHSNFKYNSTILTVHGCPGTDAEWRSLEKAYGVNTGRFINFLVPGFDGESEVRGDYSGSIEDICKLILMLINKLNIEKIIFSGHSMGGFIMYKFFLLYPNRVNGLIHAASPVFHWYLGIKIFYTLGYIQTGIAKDKSLLKALDNPKVRSIICHRFAENSKNIFFEGMANLQVPVAKLTENEICAFAKFCASFNVASFPSEGKKSTGVLRFLFCGKEDPLLPITEYANQFFEIINDKRGKDLNMLSKHDIDNNDELRNLNLNNLQENFMFLFEKIGHNVHKKYGRVIGHLIRKYVAVVEILDHKKKLLVKPKLQQRKKYI